MPTRAQAEDLADRVNVELEELPTVVDIVAAMRAGSSRVVQFPIGRGGPD
jgi:CO/xanthine dehydrogenase Mo-binding subunit